MIAEQYEALFAGNSKSTLLSIGAPEIPLVYNTIAMIDRLASGNILDHERVYEIPYTYALDLMSYWKRRDEYIEYENKQQLKNK